jgi:phosphoglycolate phosphatase
MHLLLRGEPLGSDPHQGRGPAAIQAVLFDKDGTLSHSEPMLEALATARIGHCLQLLDPDLLRLRGEEILQLLQRAYGMAPAGIDPGGTTAVACREHNLISTATVLAIVGLGWPEALEISERVFAHTDRLHGQGSEQRPLPTEGLAELLQRLEAAGLLCAVISNDDQRGIEEFLRASGLEGHFQALWSAGHRPAKPSPGAVHGLCSQLGVQPSRCALIGDANSDLRMALAAGLPVVLGYRAGWRQPPPLTDEVPHLQHWSELSVSP